MGSHFQCRYYDPFRSLTKKKRILLFTPPLSSSHPYRLITHKAYRLYNPKSEKVVISRDGVFAEDKAFRWTENAGKYIPLDFTDDDNAEKAAVQPNEAQSPSAAASPSAVASPSSSIHSPSTSEVTPRPKIFSRQPTWMKDYVVSNDDDDDDYDTSPVQFAFFSESDPVEFSKAACD